VTQGKFAKEESKDIKTRVISILMSVLWDQSYAISFPLLLVYW